MAAAFRYEWIIENFSNLHRGYNYVDSPQFSSPERPNVHFSMRLFPKGFAGAPCDDLLVLLKLVSWPALDQANVKYKLVLECGDKRFAKGKYVPK